MTCSGKSKFLFWFVICIIVGVMSLFRLTDAPNETISAYSKFIGNVEKYDFTTFIRGKFDIIETSGTMTDIIVTDDIDKYLENTSEDKNTILDKYSLYSKAISSKLIGLENTGSSSDVRFKSVEGELDFNKILLSLESDGTAEEKKTGFFNLGGNKKEQIELVYCFGTEDVLLEFIKDTIKTSESTDEELDAKANKILSSMTGTNNLKTVLSKKADDLRVIALVPEIYKNVVHASYYNEYSLEREYNVYMDMYVLTEKQYSKIFENKEILKYCKRRGLK